MLPGYDYPKHYRRRLDGQEPAPSRPSYSVVDTAFANLPKAPRATEVARCGWLTDARCWSLLRRCRAFGGWAYSSVLTDGRRASVHNGLMRARAFLRAVTVDHTDALDRFLTILGDAHVEWCVVGGLGVNAYVEPVVTLDMDLVVIAKHVGVITASAMQIGFRLQTFEHSVNLTAPQSDLRIQIQTDSRYQPFVARARPRRVLDLVMPVADVTDLLEGKVWAFQDVTRRASKRQKDLADIARLLEAFPELRAQVPDDILNRLV